MKRILAGREVPAAEINLSPLIDCVFLLLIFFVVYAVFAQPSGLNISRPRAVSAETLREQGLVLVIGPDGSIEAEGRMLASAHVRGWVADRMRRRPRPVIVMADRSLQTGLLVEVVDACRLGGAEEVLVGAENPVGADSRPDEP